MKNPNQVNTQRPGFWSGALFGALAGISSLLTFQYLSGILKQPRLMPWTILSQPEEFETQEALALFIATENLRSGIQIRRLRNGQYKEVLHAGYRNFRESWARDFGFASYGLLALDQYETVRQTLEAFLAHQTPEGQLPVKLHSMDFVTRYFHSFLGREQSTEGSLRPKYISAHGAPSLDGQAILVISALTYARKTKNVEFLRTYWGLLVNAVQWMENHKLKSHDELLYQESFADWADSVARRGYVHYTNVVYWKALTEMAQTASDLDMVAHASFYRGKAHLVSSAIQEKFWHPKLGYFVTSDTLSQLNSDGNLLAIAWELATPEQAGSILTVMEEAGMSTPVPTRCTSGPYPAELIAIANVLGGVPNYHTDAAWMWLGAWHVIALCRCGDLAKAQELLSRMASVIVRDKQIHEVYGTNGEPLASMWYKPEAPLTWNAGMFIYACKYYEEAKIHASKLIHTDT
ncbi:MAG: glycoside hydrolase family 15 protein [Byssovorax cruenta]|jgi:glycogen debranching enzyme